MKQLSWPLPCNPSDPYKSLLSWKTLDLDDYFLDPSTSVFSVGRSSMEAARSDYYKGPNVAD